MSVVVHCPNFSCGQRLRVAGEGRRVRCPSCRELFRLVSPEHPQAVPAPGTTTVAYVAAGSQEYSLSTLDSVLPVASPERPTWQTAKAPTDAVPVGAKRPTKLHTTQAFADTAVDMPNRIGRYQVRCFVGEGAFGKVYEAHDPQLDRVVALKVAKPSQLLTPERVRRFVREARAAAGLRHPGILPVFEANQEGTLLYIATAFITGHTLENTCVRQRPGLSHSVQIIRLLAEALAYAHGQGIVHRDVKPANIMLDERGQPILMDFGLAFRMEPGERLTQQGDLVGTPLYMAPEQARGSEDAALPASDQYSLGVLFFELLTGQPPFPGPAAVAMFHHLETRPPRPSLLDPRLPQDLEAICLRCLEKEPARRFPSCQHLAEALAAWQQRPLTPDLPRPTPSSVRPRLRSQTTHQRFLLLWVALWTSVFVLGTLFASWIHQTRTAPEPPRSEPPPKNPQP